MADNTDKKKLLRSATCGTFLSSSHCRKCFMSSAIKFCNRWAALEMQRSSMSSTYSSAL